MPTNNSAAEEDVKLRAAHTINSKVPSMLITDKAHFAFPLNLRRLVLFI